MRREMNDIRRDTGGQRHQTLTALRTQWKSCERNVVAAISGGLAPPREPPGATPA
jgi:hypothetical protein